MNEKIKILVAEDEKIIGMDIKKILVRFGYEVTSIVGTGIGVIEKAASEQPDLILMDIKLTGLLDGIEAAKIISFKHKIPVIFITALNNRETIQRINGSGAFGFLLKPFSEQKLHEIIEKALETSRNELATGEHHYKSEE